MDFYLASDSSPAIHSKTTAKVRKRIGICKKIEKFLANPNKNGYKAAYKQGFCPYRAQGNNALIPRAMPWARSFWAFSPCLNHMQKFSQFIRLPPFSIAKNASISIAVKSNSGLNLITS